MKSSLLHVFRNPVCDQASQTQNFQPTREANDYYLATNQQLHVLNILLTIIRGTVSSNVIIVNCVTGQIVK